MGGKWIGVSDAALQCASTFVESFNGNDLRDGASQAIEAIITLVHEAGMDPAIVVNDAIDMHTRAVIESRKWTEHDYE